MKKSSELVSLRELELDLSRTGLKYLEKNFSLEEIVLTGRKTAYKIQWGAEIPHCTWKINVATALTRAGYVRSDIRPRTFSVAKLYKRVYHGMLEIPTSVDEIRSNQEYENLIDMTGDQFALVISELKKRLNDNEFEIIDRRFGLYGGDVWSLGELGIMLNMTPEEIKKLESRAIKKLRKDMIPIIF